MKNHEAPQLSVQGRTQNEKPPLFDAPEIFDRACITCLARATQRCCRTAAVHSRLLRRLSCRSFIKARDYMTAMEGVPIRFVSKGPETVPAYMDIGVTALKRALLRSKHQRLRSDNRRAAQLPAERARRVRQVGMA